MAFPRYIHRGEGGLWFKTPRVGVGYINFKPRQIYIVRSQIVVQAHESWVMSPISPIQ